LTGHCRGRAVWQGASDARAAGLPAHLRELRETAGPSQDGLARGTGLPNQRTFKLEAGAATRNKRATSGQPRHAAEAITLAAQGGGDREPV
jgi:hypothetical protein